MCKWLEKHQKLDKNKPQLHDKHQLYLFSYKIYFVALFASQFMQYDLQVIYNHTSFNAFALLRKVFGTRHAFKVKPG